MSIKKTTEQFAQELLDKFGLVLTGEYKGAHSTVDFVCKNGHTNSAVATNLIRRGYTCKQCKHNRLVVPKVQWGTGALEELLELTQAGKTLEEIAKYFSTTPSAINNACAKFEISRSKSINTYTALAAKVEGQGRILLTPKTEFNAACTYVTIKCPNGHSVKQLASNVMYKDTGCPQCSFADGKSKTEHSLIKFIQDNYAGWIELGDRTILAGKELDIVLPDLGLALEYNGEYWHSEQHVKKDYHINKTEMVEDFGYRLVHVPEHSWLKRTEQWKSYILNLIGRTAAKIPARKTTIKKLDFWPRDWLEANHLQGAGSPTGINYALMLGEEMVACMTFSKPRFTKQYEWELVRYCTKLNTIVVGGASKLIRAFEQEYAPQSLVSYANRYWSQGNVYKTLGFTHSHNSEPGYYYAKRLDTISRYQAQKHKLPDLLKDFDPQLTEVENMHNNGYFRVWDCGNQVWVKSYLLAASK